MQKKTLIPIIQNNKTHDLFSAAADYATERANALRGKRPPDPTHYGLGAGFAAALVANLTLNLAGLDSSSPVIYWVATLIGGSTWALLRHERGQWNKIYDEAYAAYLSDWQNDQPAKETIAQ